jgi:hypothetical protein
MEILVTARMMCSWEESFPADSIHPHVHQEEIYFWFDQKIECIELLHTFGLIVSEKAIKL